MPINPNIISGLRPLELANPLASYAQFQQAKLAQNENKLADLKMIAANQDVSDDAAMREAYKQYSDPAERLNALARGGNYRQVKAEQSLMAERQKALNESNDKQAETANRKATTSKINFEVNDQKINAVRARIGSFAQMPNVTPQIIASGMQDLVRAGYIDREDYDSMIVGMPQDKNQLTSYLSHIDASLVSASDRMKDKTSRDNNAATVGATTRGQDMVDDRSREAASAAMSKPFEVEQDGLPVLVRQDRQGNLTKVKGFGPKSGGAKLTEDQGKATGWLVQAENAYKNMMSVGADKNGNPTSASQPGFNDALAAIPSFGATAAIANKMRGADRQKFIQASSSLSESLLRAATGAGVNKDEARQKVEELTPVYGEDKETTLQKYAAIPLYIESLKVRAGPGAKKAEGVINKSSAPISIANAADYAKVPSGSEYIAPDGTRRRKP